MSQQSKHISQATIIGQRPPTTWQEYARDCRCVFGGGYRTAQEREIFHHGIQTAFNAVEADMPPLALCKRADANQAKATLCDELAKALRDVVGRVKACAEGADQYAELIAVARQGDVVIAEYEKMNDPT